MGWVEGRPPKFIAVAGQRLPAHCQGLQRGQVRLRALGHAATVADGLRVPHPFADYLILQAIRETGGTALAVEDQEMVDAMYELATTEGIIACPRGAAPWWD